MLPEPVARKEIEVEPLVSGVFPLHNAGTVYADLSSAALKAVGVLLKYPPPDPESPPRTAASLVRAGTPKAPNGNGSPGTRPRRSGSSAPATMPPRRRSRSWPG